MIAATTNRKGCWVTSTHVWFGWGLASLLGLVIGCSKSEVQAPAKEAPTSVAPPTDRQSPDEVGSPAPPPGAAPSPVDRWPQAEAQPGSLRREGERSQTSPSPPAEAREKKKDESGAARSAPKASLGGRGASSEEASDVDLLARAEEATVKMDDALERMNQALELAVPDCSAAERFRQNVCNLADHICSIEQGLPQTTPRRCEDGKKRCADASKRYQTKCDG